MFYLRIRDIKHFNLWKDDYFSMVEKKRNGGYGRCLYRLENVWWKEMVTLAVSRSREHKQLR